MSSKQKHGNETKIEGKKTNCQQGRPTEESGRVAANDCSYLLGSSYLLNCALPMARMPTMATMPTMTTRDIMLSPSEEELPPLQ